jgi:hypothetical protein
VYLLLDRISQSINNGGEDGGPLCFLKSKTMNFLANDPLLGRSAAQNVTLQDLDAAQEELARKMENLRSMQQASRMQQEQSKTPIWDEIDGLIASMSEKELQFLSNAEEFQASNERVLGVLNREYLRIMRPIVEGTKDGKEALEAHLTLVRKLKKDAADEVNRKYALLDEYMEKGGDMTLNEFIKLKKTRT